jgi:ABC-type bacteriocin/lantibiotic exporter with double-glycine peptidase domain|tara:strand:+ start:113552 stop:115258 length:1707 start_codon:yes stop_codon:yes gene_type:complete
MNSNSTLSPVQRFWLLLKPDKKEIRNVYSYAFFNGLVNLSLPIGIQAIINLIQGGQVSTSWIVLVAFVIAGITISGLLQVSQMRITENLQQKIFARASFEFAYRLPRIKLEALYKHHAPELMNRFFDVMSVQKGLSKMLIDFSTASIQVVFGLILLSLYHPFFIIFSLILVILIYAIFKITGRIGLQTSLVESKYKYNVAHWLQEVARTNVSFKLAGKTDITLEKTDKEVGKYIDARESHFKILKQQYYLMIVFKVLVAAGLLIIGGILVIEQQMNIGQFVASEIIILLILGSVEKLILSLEVVYDVLTALEKIGQVTDLELDPTSGIDMQTELGEKGMKVEFQNVTFCYPDQKKKILNNFSLKIEQNEKIMIAGQNDSGKSTLVSLIAGLYQPTEGFIGYNDFPQGNLNPITLRSSIGECLSSELLFKGSLVENITMGRKRATFENVKWAIDNLGLTSVIKDLPEGYDTEIKPQGQQFSKSVINRLLIARSIADKPKLLVIKDIFASLSLEEKIKIIDFLVHPDNLWTLVVVSTEKEIASRMDRIAFLKSGQLDRIGTYEEMKNHLG